MLNHFSLVPSCLSYLLHIILLLVFFFMPRPIVVPRNHWKCVFFFQNLHEFYTQNSILSYFSTSLQVYLMIFYNSLVNTPTGIKQIGIFYWSAILPKNENFRLAQSLPKTPDNISFKLSETDFQQRTQFLGTERYADILRITCSNGTLYTPYTSEN